MRNILIDMVRQTKDLFETVKITGDAATTKIQAVDKDKTMFLQASLKEVEPNLEGEFGISNLALLDGLLNFSSYKGDNSKFDVRREVKNGSETVTAFVFKDANGKGSTYKTMAAHLVNEQATISSIPWNIKFSPSKSKISEFSQLSKLYSEVDKTFKVLTEDGDLVFCIGDDTSSTHNASLVFESGVEGELKGDIAFDIFQFLSLMKIAGSYPTTMNITSKGILGVTVEAPTGDYNYFLRAKR